MAAVTQPGAFHTAGSAHLEGIDLAGKTGTAQLMSHEALGRTNKGRSTYPNVWFVGVTPRRNPELVVAVLWQNGEFSYFPARLGARVVAAYVEKKRRLEKNLTPPKPATPVEVGALWTAPASTTGNGVANPARLQSGHFFVGAQGVIEEQSAKALPTPADKPGHLTLAPSQLGAASPVSARKAN